jgi:hypothetical protein
MKLNKLVLALSLAAASSAATAASVVTPFTPAAGMGDAIILQTQVASGVQMVASVESGIAIATLGNNQSISPTATIAPEQFNGVTIVSPTSTVSSVVPPTISVYGDATASALVTQDALGLVVVPTSAINSIATLVGITPVP